jgi:hypothetical protein
MNTNVKSDTATLLALASKLDQRTNLFLQAVSLLQEHQALNRRLIQQVLVLQTEVDHYATRSNPIPDGPNVQDKTWKTSGQDHGNANSPGSAGNPA